MHTPTRPVIHTYARTHAHAYKDKCNIYCFSTAAMIRERASVLRYTYIACLVLYLQALTIRILKRKRLSSLTEGFTGPLLGLIVLPISS
jgi:FtsH-binding integral membrane protein